MDGRGGASLLPVCLGGGRATASLPAHPEGAEQVAERCPGG